MREEIKAAYRDHKIKEEVKTHIEKHKALYSGLGVALASVGLTTLVMKGRHATARGVVDGPVRVTVQPFSLFSNRQETKVETTVHRGGTGSPGYVVEDVNTGEAWLSQRQASFATGVPETVLSGHLNGKFPDADGRQFRRIGLSVA